MQLSRGKIQISQGGVFWPRFGAPKNIRSCEVLLVQTGNMNDYVLDINDHLSLVIRLLNDRRNLHNPIAIGSSSSSSSFVTMSTTSSTTTTPQRQRNSGVPICRVGYGSTCSRCG